MTKQQRALRDPLAGLRGELRDEYDAQPAALRAAYRRFWNERVNRRAAHRDTLEAFISAWRQCTERRRAA